MSPETFFLQPPITKATAATASKPAAPVSPVAVPTTATTTSSVDLGQQLFNAANNNDIAKMTSLLNTPGVDINFTNAVSMSAVCMHF